ncbi:aminoglycoside N(3)-acetyltransferase [Nocardiopsis salina]|uniref:aminoglycoside N(3)-acetyltransferase n=1 Tax=Nocardiopsis salina TaxID=245836 RepID=UPI0003469BBA|nr:AAC(3) family N-acetyltransferase [Nocardiopsis salina]
MADRTLCTRESLTSDLTGLGLAPGSTVLVHSSLKSLGWVCGGVPAVVQALTDAVGHTGTVVVPTQSGEYSDPAGWQNPPVPESWWQTIREHMPAYDPAVTPTAGMGRVPEQLRTWPGAVRSAHPQVSFAALGARARELMEPHPLEDGLGPDSPLGRMAGSGAQVLFLGTGYATCTAFHLAEYRIPVSSRMTCGAPVLDASGKRVWTQYTDVALDERDFTGIGMALEQAQHVTVGAVGTATARLFPMAEAVDFAAEWMRRHRTVPRP